MADLYGGVPREVVEELQTYADAARWRMCHQTNKRIHPQQLALLPAPAVISEYVHFLDAKFGEGGLLGCDGQPSKYRLKKIPAGGAWEKLGMAGSWHVLHESERLTKDGVERGANKFRAGEGA
jgi:hypothetical protein